MASFTTPPLSFLAWNFQRTRDFFDRSYVIRAAIFLRVNDTLAMFDDIAIFGCVNRSSFQQKQLNCADSHEQLVLRFYSGWILKISSILIHLEFQFNKYDNRGKWLKVEDFDVEDRRKVADGLKKFRIFTVETCNKREIISKWLHSNFTQHHQFANGTDGVWFIAACTVFSQKSLAILRA